MIDMNRPETWSIVAMLMVAVIAFMRGAVIPGVIHDKIVAQVRQDYERHIQTLDRDIALWKEIALRGVQLSEKSLDVVKKVKE